MGDGRVISLFRCLCGYCQPMQTMKESTCCLESDKVNDKLANFDGDLDCLTHHVGFDTVCLDMYVLECTCIGYRQGFPNSASSSVSYPDTFLIKKVFSTKRMTTQIHKQLLLLFPLYGRYKYTSYRQFVRWKNRYLGKELCGGLTFVASDIPTFHKWSCVSCFHCLSYTLILLRCYHNCKYSLKRYTSMSFCINYIEEGYHKNMAKTITMRNTDLN